MNCNTTHYRANSSSVPGDPTRTWRKHGEYRAHLITALAAANLLATEQEWGIKTESGMILDGARDQAYAERWAAGCTNTNALTGEVRTGTAVAVSRGVTPWTEVTS